MKTKVMKKFSISMLIITVAFMLGMTFGLPSVVFAAVSTYSKVKLCVLAQRIIVFKQMLLESM